MQPRVPVRASHVLHVALVHAFPLQGAHSCPSAGHIALARAVWRTLWASSRWSKTWFDLRAALMGPGFPASRVGLETAWFLQLPSSVLPALNLVVLASITASKTIENPSLSLSPSRVGGQDHGGGSSLRAVLAAWQGWSWAQRGYLHPALSSMAPWPPPASSAPPSVTERRTVLPTAVSAPGRAAPQSPWVSVADTCVRCMSTTAASLPLEPDSFAKAGQRAHLHPGSDAPKLPDNSFPPPQSK